MSAGTGDKIKGRVQKATGELTNDQDLKDRGRVNETSGKLKDGVTHRLADTVGGLAVPPGSAKPDVSTPEKLKAAFGNA